jgi:hypothetical protein
MTLETPLTLLPSPEAAPHTRRRLSHSNLSRRNLPPARAADNISNTARQSGDNLPIVVVVVVVVVVAVVIEVWIVIVMISVILLTGDDPMPTTTDIATTIILILFILLTLLLRGQV